MSFCTRLALPHPWPRPPLLPRCRISLSLCSLLRQGSDGYHRHWKGYGQIYTGPIHEGKYGGKDYLQIQDLVTGEVEYFRFRFT